MIDWTLYIKSDPDILFGKPVIVNTRIPVDLILEKLAAGDTYEDLLEAYPAITKDHIAACLLFAAELMKSKTVINIIIKEPFDYTNWQDALRSDNTVELISEKAVDYRARKHGKGPKMNKVLAMNVKEKIEKELARLSNHELIILHEIIRSIRSVKKTKRSAIAVKAPYLRVREALKDSGNLSEDILAERTEAL